MTRTSCVVCDGPSAIETVKLNGYDIAKRGGVTVFVCSVDCLIDFAKAEDGKRRARWVERDAARLEAGCVCVLDTQGGDICSSYVEDERGEGYCRKCEHDESCHVKSDIPEGADE